VENHVEAVPDPSVMVGREVSIVPIEVVVRGYLAGSAWRDYVQGAPISGVKLPGGLRHFERLPEPIITPSTKESVGSHDLPISENEIVTRGIVSPEVWEEIREKALALFHFASQEVGSRGLLLADTKYEFGLLEGRVVLADEIHTLDCSRFWVADTYEERLRSGEAPEMVDKEPVRRWLLDRGFKGDGTPPPIPDEYRYELMCHYVRSFERIAGVPCDLDYGDPLARIESNLKRYFAG
jgi:phosphoribosylaminoimidazole-succinocarboxamide synthase